MIFFKDELSTLLSTSEFVTNQLLMYSTSEQTTLTDLDYFTVE